MKAFGIALLVLGLGIMAMAAFALSTTASDHVFISPSDLGETLNLGKLQDRELTFLFGGIIMICGAVLTGAGAIVEVIESRLRQVRPRQAGNGAPAPSSAAVVLPADAAQPSSDAAPASSTLASPPYSPPPGVEPSSNVSTWLAIGGIALIVFFLVFVAIGSGETGSGPAAQMNAAMTAPASNGESDAVSDAPNPKPSPRHHQHHH